MIFGVPEELASWARFYLEPVDPGGGRVDATVSHRRPRAGGMTTAIRDARPPAAMIRVLNPIMRVLLPSRLGRLVRPFALIEFTGRRSGSRYRVPAGLHHAAGVTVVFTPAAWRANFIGGAAATLHHRGRARQMIGTLVTDPAEVADALRSVLAGGTSPRLLGLDIPSEHRVDASDIASVGRSMIRFHPDNAPSSNGRLSAPGSSR